MRHNDLSSRFRKQCQQYREEILVFLLLGGLAVLFLSSSLLGGKALLPGDLLRTVSPWNQDNVVPFVPHNPFLSDPIYIYYPNKLLFWESLKVGHFPRMNPYIFAGFPMGPTATALSSDLGQVATEWPALVLPLKLSFGWVAAWRLTLAGFFMFLLLRRGLRAGLWGGLLAAVLYMFNLNTVVWLEFPSHLAAQVWVPLSFLCAIKTTERQSWAYAVLTGITMALLAYNWYIQLAMFALVGLGLYWLWQILPALLCKDLKTTVRQMAAGIVAFGSGLLLSSTKIWAYAEAVQLSIRGEQGTTRLLRAIPLSWSALTNTAWRALHFLLPNFYGDGVTHEYWGRHNPVEDATYLGIVPLVLLTVYLIRWRQIHRDGVFFLALGISMLMVMWRIPVFTDLWMALPYVRFGAVSRLMTMVCFALAVVAGLVLTSLRDAVPKDRKSLNVSIVLASMGMVAVTLYGLYSQRVILDLRTGGWSLQWSNLKHFALLLVVYLAIWGLYAGRRISHHTFGLAAVALLAVDLFAAGIDFNTTVPPNTIYQTPESIEFLERDARIYRVLSLQRQGDLFPSNSLMAYRIPQVGGYDTLLPKRYRDFLQNVMGESDIAPNGVVRLHSLARLDLWGMLNVRYILSPAPLPEEETGELSLVQDGVVKIYANRLVLPRAFIVPRAHMAHDDEEIIEIMTDPGFDPRQTVILEEDPVFAASIGPLPANPEPTVRITHTNLDSLRLEVELAQKGYLFFSYTFCPDWHVKVNGTRRPVYRANYAFMSLPLTAGRHEVLLQYQPRSRTWGVVTRVSVTLALSIILVGDWLKERRRLSQRHRRSEEVAR